MTVYRNPDFRRLPPELAALFEASARRSFFATPAWYDLMTRHATPPGTETRLHTVDGVGMVLQVEAGEGRRLASLANFYSVEHGPIVDGVGDPARALRTLLGEIAAERPAWETLRLLELDPAEPAYEALLRGSRAAGFLVEPLFDSGTWYEDTAGLSFDDYVAARPSELRNTWRRKRRKIEAGSRLRKAFFAGPAGIEQAIADYEAIYANSWKPPEGFPGFIPELLRVAAAERALRLGIYSIDGTPAAAQFWIVWNGRAVIYKLAHDKRFDDLSLGTILTMEMFERVLAEDRPVEVTLGRGDDPYKKLWLPKRRERWGIRAANPRTWNGLRLGLEREAAKLYHRLRGEPVNPPDQPAGLAGSSRSNPRST